MATGRIIRGASRTPFTRVSFAGAIAARRAWAGLQPAGRIVVGTGSEAGVVTTHPAIMTIRGGRIGGITTGPAKIDTRPINYKERAFEQSTGMTIQQFQQRHPGVAATREQILSASLKIPPKYRTPIDIPKVIRAKVISEQIKSDRYLKAGEPARIAELKRQKEAPLPKWVTDFVGDPLKLSKKDRKIILPFYGKTSADALKQKKATTEYLNYVFREIKAHPEKIVLFAALPPALKAAGRGIKAAGITKLITKVPKGQLIAKRTVQLVSAGLGAAYSKDVYDRTTEPVLSGYNDGKVTTTEKTLPNGDIEITTTTEQIPMFRKPTGPEQIQRISGIFATELAPLGISHKIVNRGVKVGYKPPKDVKHRVKITTKVTTPTITKKVELLRAKTARLHEIAETRASVQKPTLVKPTLKPDTSINQLKALRLRELEQPGRLTTTRLSKIDSALIQLKKTRAHEIAETRAGIISPRKLPVSEIDRNILSLKKIRDHEIAVTKSGEKGPLTIQTMKTRINTQIAKLKIIKAHEIAETKKAGRPEPTYKPIKSKIKKSLLKEKAKFKKFIQDESGILDRPMTRVEYAEYKNKYFIKEISRSDVALRQLDVSKPIPKRELAVMDRPVVLTRLKTMLTYEQAVKTGIVPKIKVRAIPIAITKRESKVKTIVKIETRIQTAIQTAVLIATQTKVKVAVEPKVKVIVKVSPLIKNIVATETVVQTAIQNAIRTATATSTPLMRPPVIIPIRLKPKKADEKKKKKAKKPAWLSAYVNNPVPSFKQFIG